MKISKSRKSEEEFAALHSLGGMLFWQRKCHFPKYMSMSQDCPVGWSFQSYYKSLPFSEIPHRLAERERQMEKILQIYLTNSILN
jgi:hypothetical protein